MLKEKLRNAVYRLLHLFLELARYALFVKLTVEGREKLSRRAGPLIIVTNHISLFDAALVLVIPFQVVVLAAHKHRFNPVLQLAHRIGYCIFVRRGTADHRAIKQALRVLEHGGVLLVAPEGTRSGTGILGRGRVGAAYLALKSGATILPMALLGTGTVIRSLMQGRRPEITVRVGEPFNLNKNRLGEQNNRFGKAQLTEVTDKEIMPRIAELLPPARRGVYAEIPARKTAS